MITVQDLKTKKPDDMADDLAYAVNALIKVARIALENEEHHECAVHCATTVLDLAEEFGELLSEGVELLERKSNRGTLKRTAN